MEKRGIKNRISKLPDAPGVYKFLRKNKILYIGKATSLRDRVRSYFNGSVENTRGPLISKMLSQFDDIKFQKTDSVLEALILEANLIKKHQPEANTAEKDDKSFNFVVITKEDFPRVLVVRGKELEQMKAARTNSEAVISERNLAKPAKEFVLAAKFGPFTNSGQLKEAMKIVRKMFPFRDKCDLPTRQIVSKKILTEGKNIFSTRPNKGNPCFNRQIGLCPGVCTGEISKKDYAKQIKNIILFFEGKKKLLVKRLEKEMKELAKKREFEKAQKVKRQIFALYHIQDIALIKNQVSKSDFDTKFRIESYDVAHLSGTNVVGVMTVMEDGEVKKSDYRKFSARGGSAFGGKTVLGNSRIIDDTKALAEILTRRLNHPEWAMPNLIVVDGGAAQKRTMEKVLKQNNFKIPVVSVVKDERHRPKGIIVSEAVFSERKIAKRAEGTIISFGKYKKEILLANAEAHRFAISFHKHLRSKLF